MSPSPDTVELVVSCKSWQEAQNVTDVLFERKFAKSVETIEVATSYMRKHTTGQTHSVKLIIQTSGAKAASVKQVVRAARNQASHPPYTLQGAHLPSIVTKWLRSATEVKSVKLK